MPARIDSVVGFRLSTDLPGQETVYIGLNGMNLSLVPNLEL